MTKRVLAIGGGKGGVGKSLIASNLAIAMAQSGNDVILVDADLGGANLHTIFGIDRPDAMLEQFISRDVEHLSDIVLPTQEKGLRLICGGMPVLGTANPKFSQKQRLINHILKLDTEIIIIDTGAGAGFNVLDLFNAADQKIVVFTPQLTSLHNGYGFLKAAILRAMQRAISPPAREFLTATGPETAGENLPTVLARLNRNAPEEKDKIEAVLRDISISIVGNMIRSKKEDHVMAAISKMIRDHLQINAPVIGLIRFGEKLLKSVNDRRPFMSWAGIESNAEAFRSLAWTLTAAKIKSRGGDGTAQSLRSEKEKNDTYERKEARYPVSWKAILERNGRSHVGMLSNVAYGGALVVFESQIDVPNAGEVSSLIIGPTKSGESISLKVEERHRDETGRQIGYAFQIDDDNAREALERLVAGAATTAAMS